MGFSMSLLERIYYFHSELLKQSFPNSRSLTEEFEISPATARRDITYLRDRLLAPLAFSHQKNGFYYTDQSFTLPFENSPKITYMLGLLSKLAGEAGLGSLPEVKQLQNRLGAMLMEEHQRLIEAVYCERIEIEEIAPQVFEIITESIVKSQLLLISYSPPEKQPEKRIIESLKLINYQGRWYLAAYCTLRNDFRIFHLSRIKSAKLYSERVNPARKLPDAWLEQSFGIFKGETKYHAKIEFSSSAAELVSHQRWHHDQTITPSEKGIILSLPVNEPRELIMKILQYGARAKVLEPPELKKKLVEEVTKMEKIYSQGESSRKLESGAK